MRCCCTDVCSTLVVSGRCLRLSSRSKQADQRPAGRGHTQQEQQEGLVVAVPHAVGQPAGSQARSARAGYTLATSGLPQAHQGQWWSMRMTQRLHTRQWCARGGLARWHFWQKRTTPPWKGATQLSGRPCQL